MKTILVFSPWVLFSFAFWPLGSALRSAVEGVTLVWHWRVANGLRELGINAL